MNEEALKEKIKLLEQIVELQEKLLAQKTVTYPVYVPYTAPPLYDPWKPWKPYYYEQQPHTTTTTTAGVIPWAVECESTKLRRTQC